MGKRLLAALSVWFVVALGVWVFISRIPLLDGGLSSRSAPGVEPRQEAEPSRNTRIAVELSGVQREISDFLVSAQSVDLGDDQFERFETLLRQAYSSPLREETRASLAKFRKTVPLFAASEEALFTCMRGVKANPSACDPAPRYQKMLRDGVAGGDLSREEADKYLEILASMKDPAKRPPLPDGGLDFMEKESAMRVRNFSRIAATFERVERAN